MSERWTGVPKSDGMLPTTPKQWSEPSPRPRNDDMEGLAFRASAACFGARRQQERHSTKSASADTESIRVKTPFFQSIVSRSSGFYRL
jgi:hypothetical protein